MRTHRLSRGAVVQIDTRHRARRIGITQSVTQSCVWFSSPSRFETGERLCLRLRDQNGDTDLKLMAVVVETHAAALEEGKLFRYATRARLETTLLIEPEAPTRPRVGAGIEVADRLQTARDNWLLSQEPAALRRALIEILDLLSY